MVAPGCFSRIPTPLISWCTPTSPQRGICPCRIGPVPDRVEIVGESPLVRNAENKGPQSDRWHRNRWCTRTSPQRGAGVSATWLPAPESLVTTHLSAMQIRSVCNAGEGSAGATMPLHSHGHLLTYRRRG